MRLPMDLGVGWLRVHNFALYKGVADATQPKVNSLQNTKMATKMFYTGFLNWNLLQENFKIYIIYL